MSIGSISAKRSAAVGCLVPVLLAFLHVPTTLAAAPHPSGGASTQRQVVAVSPSGHAVGTDAPAVQPQPPAAPRKSGELLQRQDRRKGGQRQAQAKQQSRLTTDSSVATTDPYDDGSNDDPDGNGVVEQQSTPTTDPFDATTAGGSNDDPDDDKVSCGSNWGLQQHCELGALGHWVRGSSDLGGMAAVTDVLEAGMTLNDVGSFCECPDERQPSIKFLKTAYGRSFLLDENCDPDQQQCHVRRCLLEMKHEEAMCLTSGGWWGTGNSSGRVVETWKVRCVWRDVETMPGSTAGRYRIAQPFLHHRDRGPQPAG